MDTEREVFKMVHTVIKGTKTIAEFKELREKNGTPNRSIFQ